MRCARTGRWRLRWKRGRLSGMSVVTELGSPNDGQLLRDSGEVGVAGDQWGFIELSHGGCKAIDVRKLVIGFQFGSAAGKFHIRRDDGNGQLCDFCQDVVSVAGPPVAPNSIENLTPVHGAK